MMAVHCTVYCFFINDYLRHYCTVTLYSWELSDLSFPYTVKHCDNALKDTVHIYGTQINKKKYFWTFYILKYLPKLSFLTAGAECSSTGVKLPLSIRDLRNNKRKSACMPYYFLYRPKVRTQACKFWVLFHIFWVKVADGMHLCRTAGSQARHLVKKNLLFKKNPIYWIYFFLGLQEGL